MDAAPATGPLPIRLLEAIIGLTVAKVFVVMAFVRSPRVFEDAAIAETLVRTGEYVYPHLGQPNHTLQFPVYPLSVAGVYALFGVRPLPVLLFNLIVSGVTAWVLAHLVQRWLGDLDPEGRLGRLRPAVLWATVLAFLVHPPLNQYVMNSIHPLSVDMLAFYLALLSGYWYLERGERSRDLLWLGVLAGAVLLTRTVMLAGFLPLLVTAARRAGWAEALRRLAVVLALALAFGSPWLVRNYLQDGIVGYTSSTGEILWKGVLPGTDGSNYVGESQSYLDAMPAADRARLERMTVAEQNAHFTRSYLQTVRDEPARVGGMFLLKLRNFFWFRSLFGNEYGPAMRRLIPYYKAAFAVLLAGALLSLVIFRGRAWVVGVPIVALGIAQSLFYVETRHRVAIEPLLIFLTVATLAALAARRTGQALW